MKHKHKYVDLRVKLLKTLTNKKMSESKDVQEVMAELDQCLHLICQLRQRQEVHPNVEYIAKQVYALKEELIHKDMDASTSAGGYDYKMLLEMYRSQLERIWTTVPVAAPEPVPVAAPEPVPVAAPEPVPVAAPEPVPVAAPEPVPVAAPELVPVPEDDSSDSDISMPGLDHNTSDFTTESDGLTPEEE